MTQRNGDRGPHRALRLTVADELAAVREVRTAVERLGAEAGLPQESLFALKVAATEAVANALRHAGENGDAEVMLAAGDDAMEVEVANSGAFRVGGTLDPEHGRGLPLMLALVDEVEFAASPAGTRVRLRMRTNGARAAA